MHVKITPEKKSAFLTALAETYSVTAACKAVGISRPTAYMWRNSDIKFAMRWDRALEWGAGILKDEAVRRAMGYEVPVFHEGVEVGTTIKHSDGMLKFMLQGAFPEQFNMKRFKPEDFVAEWIEVTPKLLKAQKALLAQYNELIEEKELMDKMMAKHKIVEEKKEKECEDLV